MKKRFVLVVETDPVARGHLTNLLETWGYEPVVANSVDESLALLAHSHFHFSLLDLDLDGTDGNELLKRLRVQGGDPGAIIVMSRTQPSVTTPRQPSPLWIVVCTSPQNAPKPTSGPSRSWITAMVGFGPASNWR